MNAYIANIINSSTLLLIGFWGYVESTSVTALIPVFFGLVLLLSSKGVKTQNKIIAHVAVTLTLIILIALVGMRLPKSIDAGGLGLLRVLVMVFTCIISMVYFIKSFIDARKNRES